jgi:hypothetical protein
MKFTKAFDNDVCRQLSALGFVNVEVAPRINRFCVDYVFEAYPYRKTGTNEVGVSLYPACNGLNSQHQYINLSHFTTSNESTYLLPKKSKFTASSILGNNVLEVAKKIGEADSVDSIIELFMNKKRTTIIDKILNKIIGESYNETTLRNARHFISENSTPEKA